MVYIIYGHAKHLDDDKYWDTIGYETDLKSSKRIYQISRLH